MSDGLITRIGKWWDSKFEEKATAEAFISLSRDVCECQNDIKRLDGVLRALPPAGVIQSLSKDQMELKERLGHLEVYVGMKRVVDPAKPAVAKSAFAM